MKSSKPKTDQLKKAVDFLLKCLQYFFNTGAILALVAIAAVVLYQIVARYALPESPVWTEELSRYLFIYCIVLTSGTVIIKGRHVRLDLFHHRLSEKWKVIYSLVSHIVVGAFCIILLQYAWKYMMIGDRKTSPALGIKMSWIFASTFIFFSLVSITCLLMFIRDLLSLSDRKEA